MLHSLPAGPQQAVLRKRVGFRCIACGLFVHQRRELGAGVAAAPCKPASAFWSVDRQAAARAASKPLLASSHAPGQPDQVGSQCSLLLRALAEQGGGGPHVCLQFCFSPRLGAGLHHSIYVQKILDFRWGAGLGLWRALLPLTWLAAGAMEPNSPCPPRARSLRLQSSGTLTPSGA